MDNADFMTIKTLSQNVCDNNCGINQNIKKEDQQSKSLENKGDSRRQDLKGAKPRPSSIEPNTLIQGNDRSTIYTIADVKLR